MYVQPTSRKLHYLLFTEYYLQRLTVLRIHLLLILSVLNIPFVPCMSQWDDHPYSCAEKNKNVSKSFSLRLLLSWHILGDHKQEFIMIKAMIWGKFFKCLFRIYCIKSFWHTYTTGCGSFQTWFLIKKKKKICSRFFRESLPLGSWFWPSAKIMCKGASLGIHGSLQH